MIKVSSREPELSDMSTFVLGKIKVKTMNIIQPQYFYALSEQCLQIHE